MHACITYRYVLKTTNATPVTRKYTSVCITQRRGNMHLWGSVPDPYHSLIDPLLSVCSNIVL